MRSVFPAHAGVNLIPGELYASKIGIPRACGVEPVVFSEQGADIKYSPRMRG